jgi:hypothetical protein
MPNRVIAAPRSASDRSEWRFLYGFSRPGQAYSGSNLAAFEAELDSFRRPMSKAAA